MSEAESDETLVQHHLNGDPRAFELIVLRHRSRVYAVCVRILGDHQDAEDAAQETFLSALRKLDRFRGDALLTTWLHRIAVNACYDRLRKRQREPTPHRHEPDAADPEPVLADHADEVVGTTDVAAALARVPEEFRIAIVLADVQDLPYDEIARILGVATGTVKSRVHRGRIALARELGVPSDRGGPGREPTGEAGASEEER